MSAQGLSSRSIIGEFYNRLEVNPTPWVDQASMLFQSDQANEEYKWLGQSPAMREWIGGRNAKGFRENGLTIANKTFESTLRVSVDDLRRDKTGQVLVRISELADRTNSHWGSLLSSLIQNGATGLCYDGQYFFDTDHSEGSSGTQSNKINFDIDVDGSTVPSAEQGSTTAPGARTMEMAIMRAVQQIMGFKDDQGEPINENAQQFGVMVPTAFMSVVLTATSSPIVGAGVTNTLVNQKAVTIVPYVNPRLTWTDRFAVFRLDGQTKPFIRQEEEGVTLSAIAEGSELEHRENVHEYGVKAIRNVGYGYWQHGCQVIFT